MRDYWLSKLFYDVQANAPEYRADRAKFLARYRLKPKLKVPCDPKPADVVAYLLKVETMPGRPRMTYQQGNLASIEILDYLQGILGSGNVDSEWEALLNGSPVLNELEHKKQRTFLHFL